MRLKIKSLRNINVETECPVGNAKTDEKSDSKSLNLDINDSTITHYEQDYENAINAVSIIGYF